MSDKEKADINIKEIEFNYTPLERAARQWVTVEMSWDAYDGDWFNSGVDTFLAGAEWATPKWIKCSERLPELIFENSLGVRTSAMVLVRWLEDCLILRFISYPDGTQRFETPEGEGFGLSSISHWMPLPEAPKEAE